MNNLLFEDVWDTLNEDILNEAPIDNIKKYATTMPQIKDNNAKKGWFTSYKNNVKREMGINQQTSGKVGPRDYLLNGFMRLPFRERINLIKELYPPKDFDGTKKFDDSTYKMIAENFTNGGLKCPTRRFLDKVFEDKDKAFANFLMQKSTKGKLEHFLSLLDKETFPESVVVKTFANPKLKVDGNSTVFDLLWNIDAQFFTIKTNTLSESFNFSDDMSGARNGIFLDVLKAKTADEVVKIYNKSIKAYRSGGNNLVGQILKMLTINKTVTNNLYRDQAGVVKKINDLIKGDEDLERAFQQIWDLLKSTPATPKCAQEIKDINSTNGALTDPNPKSLVNKSITEIVHKFTLSTMMELMSNNFTQSSQVISDFKSLLSNNGYARTIFTNIVKTLFRRTP